jgi:hypothetical protein
LHVSSICCSLNQVQKRTIKNRKKNMSRKMSPEQIAKMKEGRAAAKAARDANPEQKTEVVAGTPLRLKPSKVAAVPLATANIPKGTPISGVQALIEDQVTQAAAQGVVVTRCAGRIRLY